MKKYNLTKIFSVLLMTVAAGIYMACQPEEFGDNGLTSSDPSSDFTITPVEGEVNTYVLETESKAVAFYWDNGSGKFAAGGNKHKIVLPDAGVYSIGLRTVWKGGETAVSSHELEVETSDPVAGNLVVGGRMDDPNAWTVLKINNDDNVTFTLEDGSMVVKGGGWGHRAIWQAIEVVAGRKYKLDMFVEGSGATNVWFEAYLGTQEPPASGDYSNGGIQLGLNTWTGCGNAPFSGQLAPMACVGTLKGTNKTITFEQSGTIYLLIKCGGENVGTTGISIDNVEFRGVE